MDFRPGSATLYGVLNCDNAAWHLVTINTSTGAVSDVGPTGVDQMDRSRFSRTASAPPSSGSA